MFLHSSEKKSAALISPCCGPHQCCSPVRAGAGSLSPIVTVDRGHDCAVGSGQGRPSDKGPTGQGALYKRSLSVIPILRHKSKGSKAPDAVRGAEVSPNHVADIVQRCRRSTEWCWHPALVAKQHTAVFAARRLSPRRPASERRSTGTCS